jgi:CBS domain-containing protein
MATVDEIMSRNLLTVAAGASVAEVVRQMHEREVGAVLVVEGERLAGIFTERDVLHAAASGRLEAATVGELMSAHPETIDASDTTGHAAAMMIHGGFRHLPVEKEGELAGIVSMRDLMRHVLDDESPRGA